MRKVAQEDFEALVAEHEKWAASYGKGSGECLGKRLSLKGVLLPKVHLSGRDLSSCEWHRCEMEGSVFEDCDFRAAEWIDSRFQNCTFLRCNFKKADLHGFQGPGLIFRDCSFTKADLTEVNLSGCDLSGAEFSGSFLLRTDLRKAILKKDQLQRAFASGAKVSDEP